MSVIATFKFTCCCVLFSICHKTISIKCKSKKFNYLICCCCFIKRIQKILFMQNKINVYNSIVHANMKNHLHQNQCKVSTGKSETWQSWNEQFFPRFIPSKIECSVQKYRTHVLVPVLLLLSYFVVNQLM